VCVRVCDLGVGSVEAEGLFDEERGQVDVVLRSAGAQLQRFSIFVYYCFDLGLLAL
jgi:hypothetical protein